LRQKDSIKIRKQIQSVSIPDRVLGILRPTAATHAKNTSLFQSLIGF